MSKLRLCLLRTVYAALLLALMFSFSGVIGAHAQDPAPNCSQGVCTQNADDGGITAQSGANLKSFVSTSLHGGYVAHGTGMRNLGHGLIHVSDVPDLSTVSKAYLYWGVIGPKNMKVTDTYPPYAVKTYNYAVGKIGMYLTKITHTVTGTLVGTSTNPAGSSTVNNFYAYRADVTAYMNKGGNGTYSLTGFATGETTGSEPSDETNPTYPLLEGASLVIIYNNPGYPLTTVKVYNGASTATTTPLHLSITGVNATDPTGFSQTTFIVADGEKSPSKVTNMSGKVPSCTCWVITWA